MVETGGIMSGQNGHGGRGHSRRQLIQALGLGSAGIVGAVATGMLRNRARVAILPHGDALPIASFAEARPAIVSREAWGALPVDHAAANERGLYQRGSNPKGWREYEGDLRDSYQTLILHHSAFYEADGLATLLEAQRLHRQDRLWADIGYHFLIDIDGAIYEGRDIAVRGVHAMGHNTGSAGVCLLGDFRFVAPAAAQWDATIALGRWLADELALTHLAGHSQFNPSTACPGAALLARLPELAALLDLEFGTQGYVPAARAVGDCDCCCEIAL